jgi:phosphate transport system substrate-binding protein
MAAAANANWEATPGFGVILTDMPGGESWPIANASFIVMPKQPEDAAATREALKFFTWAFAKGDRLAEALLYVPMPDNVVGAIQGAVAGVVGNESSVVSGVFNLESSGVSASDWRPRHDKHYHEA